MSEQVRVKLQEFREGQVATVTICNAHRLNSINRALANEFAQKMRRLAGNDDLRALVLTGDGDKSFIGGADIKEMQKLGDPSDAREFISRVHACCEVIRAIPVPTIARIQGYAFGAGLEMAACCDLRVASDTAVFGMPEVALGIPSVVEAALLPMLVGWGNARRILLLGENFDATQALKWGLVEQVTPRDQLDQAVQAWIERIRICGPAAVRLQKALIRSWEDLPLRAAIAAGLETFATAYETDEPRWMMQRFLDRKAQG